MFKSLLRRGAVALSGATLGLLLLTGGAFAWSGHINAEDPTNLAGQADGYYIWHDEGMHLRTTDNAGHFTYDGALHTDGTFNDVTAIRLEKGDEVTQVDDHTIRYHFVTAEGVDGFDFRVNGGTEVTFDLKQGDDKVSTDQIYLGADHHHPATDPFRIYR